MEVKVNKLPSPTMSRLKLNDAVMDIPEPKKAARPSFEGSESVTAAAGKYAGETDRELFSALAEDEKASEYVVNFNGSGERFIADYSPDTESRVGAIKVKVADGADAALIVRCLSEDVCGGFLGCKMTAELGENSVLHIVQLSAAKGCTVYSNVEGVCGERSSLKLTTVCLGAAKAYIGANCTLSGKRSAFDSETAYILGEGELLDMNYVCDHKGRKTQSLIKSSGVMKAHSQKNSRQTINFITGCSGSIGAESEDVLLLDDDVINKSLPVILCTEEDVEGEHGASIGQPDDAVMYYLKSRGLDEEKILSLLSAAKIRSAASRIEHEQTVRIIERIIGISEEDDNDDK